MCAILCGTGAQHGSIVWLRLGVGSMEIVAEHQSLCRRDGEMARGEYLANFAEEYGLKRITIEDLVQYLQAQPELQLRADN